MYYIMKISHRVQDIPLPTYNLHYFITGHILEVFQKMKEADNNIKEFYSPCLAPLQIELIKTLPTQLKSVIRLMKYWKKEALSVSVE